jgi:hypothetical protein
MLLIALSIQYLVLIMMKPKSDSILVLVIGRVIPWYILP